MARLPVAAPLWMAAARPSGKRLAIEGNIAVGKSTFVRVLRKAFPEWHMTPEPVSKWQKVRAAFPHQASPSQNVGNLLQMVYQEPLRWSYTFQTYSCLSRLKAQLQSLSEKPPKTWKPVQVFERSVYSDSSFQLITGETNGEGPIARKTLPLLTLESPPSNAGYIFAKNLFEIGHLAEIEWTIYQDWHTFLLQAFGDWLHLHGFLYLRAPPEICMERLRRRARPEEKEVQLRYLEQLHTQHENWLVEKSTEIHLENIRNAPVLMLDVTKDFENDPSEQGKLVSQVKTFIKTLSLEASASVATS